MAEEFDPAWEYYEPDPEVAWAVACERLSSFGGFGLRDDDGSGDGIGFVFGCGDPNFYRTRVAPPRYERQTADVPPRACGSCGFVFRPRESCGRYCSRECYGVARRSGQYPVRRPPARVSDCRHCGATFRPRSRRSRYCSRACHGAARALPALDVSCRQCGGSFRTRDRGRVYCSRACFGASLSFLVARPCARCGASFVPAASRVRHCSRACGWASAAESRVGIHRLPPKPCAWCGAEFRPKRSATKCCCGSCARHWRWKGSVSNKGVRDVC